MKRISMILLVLILFFMTSCEKKEQINISVEKSEIEKSLTKFWAAFENKDMKTLGNLIVHDTDIVFFGTDENERWAGWPCVESALKKQFEAFSKIKIQTHNVVIHVSPTGKTAWFSLQRYVSLMTPDSVNEGMKTRVTGVMEKRDGDWKMVQYHSSYPITDWDKFKY